MACSAGNLVPRLAALTLNAKNGLGLTHDIERPAPSPRSTALGFTRRLLAPERRTLCAEESKTQRYDRLSETVRVVCCQQKDCFPMSRSFILKGTGEIGHRVEEVTTEQEEETMEARFATMGVLRAM